MYQTRNTTEVGREICGTLYLFAGILYIQVGFKGFRSFTKKSTTHRLNISIPTLVGLQI